LILFSVSLILWMASVNNSFAATPKWERAWSPRSWLFPRDHGQHPDYQTEWWYFTGHLEGENGRHFGYQFTIFRYGIQAVPAQTASRWAIRDVWFGHFTISDLANAKFYFAERLDRGVFARSGASDQQFHVWLDGDRWKVQAESPATANPHPPLHLRAEEPDYAIDLHLRPTKAAIFHGPRNTGLSQKSPEPGNASHYYSFTRMASEGTIRIGKDVFRVKGSSWFDHEFSTSMLAENQAGWDWFSIQLDDDTELMLYQMRRKDGSVDPSSKGSFIAQDGAKEHLTAAEFVVTPTGKWKSPKSGATYPSGWKIMVPRLGLDLEITPRIVDQELSFLGDHRVLTGLAYWEGACAISGSRAGQPIRGHGYAELSGYHRPLGNP